MISDRANHLPMCPVLIWVVVTIVVCLTIGDQRSSAFASTQPPPAHTTPPKPSSSSLSPPCDCYNVTEMMNRTTVNCDCKGNLTQIPDYLSKKIQKLSLVDSEMEHLSSSSFQPYKMTLQDFFASGVKHLSTIAPGTFGNMDNLRTINIRQAPQLKIIPPDLLQTKRNTLRILRIVNSGLEEIHLNHLQTTEIMQMIDLDSNKIKRLGSALIRVKTEQLTLQYNWIEEVDARAFDGSKIGKLILKHNPRLVHLHDDSFAGLQELRELDLSETKIIRLPTAGLQRLHLKTLRLQNVQTLKVFPSVYNFHHIEEAFLTYSYHCCAFRFPETHNRGAHENYNKYVLDRRLNCASVGSSAIAKKGHIRQKRQMFGGFGTFHSVVDDNVSVTTMGDVGFGRFDLSNASVSQRGFGIDRGKFHVAVDVDEDSSLFAMCGNWSKNYYEVRCDPAPDPFNPCEDIMGNVGLRVAVWFVVVAAVLGNLAVMVVLMSSRFKMTVSKFLMCNLAFADFCMGLYLFVVAAMDLHTIGKYFNYAIDWQEGPGCKIAGFLTVFGSELSIFTLTVITLERWYAITYAIHLNKRLRLGAAARIMVFGWTYAIALAVLPLVGISGYQKTSICLPFENSDSADIAYLIVLLTVNGLAFVLICACYGKMYWSISGHNSTVTQNDKTVAKRMALLVFTDFACWAPIAFFGLTAVAGYPLIDVTNSKILLVFFYPLNSCANPFLYAIFTKQYRRDLFIMMNRYGLFASKANKYKPTYSSNLTNVGGRPPVGGGVNHSGSGGGVGRGYNHRRGSTLLTQISLMDPASKKNHNSASCPSPFATSSLIETPSPERRRDSSEGNNNGCCCTGGGGGGGGKEKKTMVNNKMEGDRRSSDSTSRRLSIVKETCSHTSEEEMIDPPPPLPPPPPLVETSGEVKPNTKVTWSGTQPTPVHRGSPHPIKNSYTKMSSSSEHELILQQISSRCPYPKRSASLGGNVEVIPMRTTTQNDNSDNDRSFI